MTSALPSPGFTSPLPEARTGTRGEMEIDRETVAGKRLWHDAADGRLIVYMHALSGAISRAYLGKVRRLVQGCLSAT